jgi:tRNA threonylcarbamoyladenosine biosynthesis protein TsaE|tara:strand:- start:4734 stop:5153 length:420 start_codon:yes stop_codon:yes gene_type:complete
MVRKIKYKLENIELAVNFILSNINTRFLLFNGTMGSGKTTLIKAIVSKLGSTDSVSSPTFSLVNEYKINNSIAYHFDFYRIENETEVLDIGIEDYFLEDSWCFMEWSEKIPNLIPDNVNYINFKVLDDDNRTIEIDLNE